MTDEELMRAALDEAKIAADLGEVPKIKCAWLPPEKEAAFLCLIPRS